MQTFEIWITKKSKNLHCGRSSVLVWFFFFLSFLSTWKLITKKPLAPFYHSARRWCAVTHSLAVYKEEKEEHGLGLGITEFELLNSLATRRRKTSVHCRLGSQHDWIIVPPCPAASAARGESRAHQKPPPSSSPPSLFLLLPPPSCVKEGKSQEEEEEPSGLFTWEPPSKK